MAGKRKLKRRNLITYLDVTNAADNRRLGRADEITVEGMRVRVGEAIDAGGIRTLRVTLPVEISGLQSFEVKVRCVACPRSSNPDVFDAHFQFIEPSPDATVTIEELILRFAQ